MLGVHRAVPGVQGRAVLGFTRPGCAEGSGPGCVEGSQGLAVPGISAGLCRGLSAVPCRAVGRGLAVPVLAAGGAPSHPQAPTRLLRHAGPPVWAGPAARPMAGEPSGGVGVTSP